MEKDNSTNAAVGQYKWMATAAFGLEGIVARELRDLRAENVTCENGRVFFNGDAAMGARANVWLRCADRVFLVVSSFRAVTFEELFQGVKAVRWADILPKDAEFPVARAKSRDSKLFSLRDIQSITKKAMVEAMKESYGISWFDENGARFPVEVDIAKDVVTLSIDSSGTGLHRRGFRPVTGEAPLRETLAAALLKIANYRGDVPFRDPMCGTGTLLLEASMIAKNAAPGLYRSFCSERWPMFSGSVYRDIRREARSLEKRDIKLDIAGSDIDPRAAATAKKHIDMANLGDQVKISVADIRDTEQSAEHMLLIMNPPYGERMLDEEGARLLTHDMGEALSRLRNARIGIISSLEEFPKYYGSAPYMNRKLYNGKLKCYYYMFGGRGR